MKKIDARQTSITKKDSLSFEKYLYDLSNQTDGEILSFKEEKELAKKIKNGDKKSENKLIKSNLKFVITVAKQYQGHGLDLEDLVAFGNLGLIKAAKRFDENKGYKFISYAVWWIRQSILESLSKNSRIVRLPSNKINIKNNIDKIKNQFNNENGREPTVSELSELLNEQEESIKKALKTEDTSKKSIEENISNDNGEERTLIDVLENENAEKADENLLDESFKKELSKILDNLDDKEKFVIKAIYGIGYDFPLSYQEIADEYELSGERIRQLRERAEKKLKEYSNCLKKYL